MKSITRGNVNNKSSRDKKNAEFHICSIYCVWDELWICKINCTLQCWGVKLLYQINSWQWQATPLFYSQQHGCVL